MGAAGGRTMSVASGGRVAAVSVQVACRELLTKTTSFLGELRGRFRA